MCVFRFCFTHCLQNTPFFFVSSLSFSHELHIHLHTPLLYLTSFSFFQLVFFLFLKRGYCTDSHARFTCTHYNTHALAQCTRTVFTICTFYFYLDLTVYALTFITMFFIFAFIFSYFLFLASWQQHSVCSVSLCEVMLLFKYSPP